jgi:hypothetical protein
MLLTITTTHVPATNLGYLLHNHPPRVQTFDLSFGQAYVCDPEAGPERYTAALLFEVDPLGQAIRPFLPGLLEPRVIIVPLWLVIDRARDRWALCQVQVRWQD